MSDEQHDLENEDIVFGKAVLRGIAVFFVPVFVIMCLAVWLITDQSLLSSIVAGLLPGALLGVFAGGFAGALRGMKH